MSKENLPLDFMVKSLIKWDFEEKDKIAIKLVVLILYSKTSHNSLVFGDFPIF
jgi:hypothetical protein